MTRSLAYASQHNIDQYDDYPVTSICLTREEWHRLKFVHIILDTEDGLGIREKDHPDGYNIILMHPETHELFWGFTADFDFTN